jgi:SulP family sulfate permease
VTLNLRRQFGVAVIGNIPLGVPAFVVPDVQYMVPLLVKALAVSIILYAEAIAVVKSWSVRFRYTCDADQELVALGLANILAAFTGGMPVGGGISRTAVNVSAGARTQVAGVMAGCVPLLAVVALAPLFFHLPRCVLSAIIIVAVVPVIDLAAPRRLWRVSKADLAMLVVAYVNAVPFLRLFFWRLNRNQVSGHPSWRIRHRHCGGGGRVHAADCVPCLASERARARPGARVCRVPRRRHCAQ